MEAPINDQLVVSEARPAVRKHASSRRLLPLYIALGSLLLATLCVNGALAVSRQVLAVPDLTLKTLSESSAGISIYDRYDRLICTVHEGRDTDPVPLSKVSMSMRNALLAVEDHKFYEHGGVDPASIARAFCANWKAGKIVEGASTLTQQLAKNLCLDKNDRSYKRKLREAILAFDLESKYSKNKILETYLNEVYYGGGVHGVERAASHYFNKHASELNLTESAFLAGLVQSPSAMGAPSNRHMAFKRRDEVLEKMGTYNFITSAEAEKAKQVQLAFKSGPHRLRYPHYVSYAVDQAEAELGAEAWTRGYKVFTHLDPAAQTQAEKTLAQGIKNAPRGIDQGALVSMSVKDGGILSMVGGVGPYQSNEWNRAIHPHTAGSTFKPFVYLAALMRGVIQQDTLIADTEIKPTEEEPTRYCPKNFDGKYRGWLTARDALIQSLNVCAVKVAQQVGISSVIETAQAAGIRSQLEQYPSTALGANAVTPLEMAAAYGTLARGGTYMQPKALRKIETTDGKLVRTFASLGSGNLPAEPVAQLVDCMQDVVRRGTGTRAYLPGIPVAGKTGTADKGKDIWFVGFTPDIVTAVWAGNDKHKAVPGTRVTGGTVMAQIWRNYMSAYYRGHKPAVLTFAPPAVPLLKEIPVFSDTDLAGGMNYTALKDAHVPPEKSVHCLPESAVPHIVSASGIASAVDIQRLESTYRSQLAQLQPDAQNQFAWAGQNPGYAANEAYSGPQHVAERVATFDTYRTSAAATAGTTYTVGSTTASGAAAMAGTTSSTGATGAAESEVAVMETNASTVAHARNSDHVRTADIVQHVRRVY